MAQVLHQGVTPVKHIRKYCALAIPIAPYRYAQRPFKVNYTRMEGSPTVQLLIVG
jgi:hypothetical protein